MAKPDADEEPTRSPARFPTMQRRGITNDAIETIKRMITQGELRAGQRLPAERELAAQLGLSRPSVRECIRALIALNILESRHGEGTFVTSLDPELLAEPIDFVLGLSDAGIASLFEARQVLESGLAALSAERATDLELAQLEDAVAAARGYMHDLDRFVEADIGFHDLVRVSARSPILSSLATSISAVSAETRLFSVQLPSARAEAVRDHAAVTAALKARDPDRARATMWAHLDHSRAAHDASASSLQ